MLHKRNRYLSRKVWRQRFNKIYDLHPEYKRKTDGALESKHVRMWRTLNPKVSLDTLRVSFNISGIASPEIVPEEIYVSEVEACLNRRREVNFLAHKSVYGRWFDEAIFPGVLLHEIDGIYFDGAYNRVDPERVGKIVDGIEYPVVIKPNMDSYGGADVYFPKNREELDARMARMKNYVIQRLIRQDEFFDRFNRVGLNTLRVCLYRSVKSNEFHILNVAFRMGMGGSLDNETAGGIICFVKEDGELNDYAVDKYGGKFSSHPDTGVVFATAGTVPKFEEMKSLAVEIATQVFLMRIVSLDMCLDTDGNWRVIEINLFGQTIRFSQYAGRPFFGDFTEEVIEYCIAHPDWR